MTDRLSRTVVAGLMVLILTGCPGKKEQANSGAGGARSATASGGNPGNPDAVSNEDLATDWFAKNCVWGPEHSLCKSFRENVGACTREGVRGRWLVGGGLLKSGTPHLVHWACGELIVCPLDPAQAASLGRSADSREMDFFKFPDPRHPEGSPFPDHRLSVAPTRILVRLSGPVMSQATGVDPWDRMQGSVSYDVLSSLPGRVALQVCWAVEPNSIPPGEGWYEPKDGRLEGKGAIAFDLDSMLSLPRSDKLAYPKGPTVVLFRACLRPSGESDTSFEPISNAVATTITVK